jgi:hypothetical protein
MPANISRPSAFSFFAVVLFVFSQGLANAAICVPATTDGPGLQGCLDTTAPGDTILLSPGTYSGPPGFAFVIAKSLTVKGTTGVVLSGSNSGHVVLIIASAGGPVTLENLTITDGNAVVFGVGGGILSASEQTVTLNNVTVQNSQAALGGGMWTSGSDTTVNSSTFINNFASVEGGAIAHEALGARNLVVYDSVFMSNDASDFGGAIVTRGVGAFFGPEQTLNIKNSTFVDNGLMGTMEGGALFITSTISSGSVSNSTFEGNHAAGFGGAVSIVLGSITLEKNTFAENISDFAGGGVYAVGSDFGDKSTNITLLKNLFYDNSAAVFGGGLYAEFISDNGTTTRGSSLTMRKNHFTENSAETAGGALIFSSSSVTMEKDHYNFNTATSEVGGLGLVNVVPNPLAGVPAGSLSKVHFNHNDANGNADSLGSGGSPEVRYEKVKIAGEDANDCVIEGDPNCP